MAFAAGDRIQFTKKGSQKLGLDNGDAGTVRFRSRNGRVFVELDDGGKTVAFDSAEYQEFPPRLRRHDLQGPGPTPFDQAYLYHSEHWRASASYVGMTRHREKAELFAATQHREGY